MRAVHTCLRVTKQVGRSYKMFSKSTHINSLLSKTKSLMSFFLAINVDILLDLVVDYLGTWNRHKHHS